MKAGASSTSAVRPAVEQAAPAPRDAASNYRNKTTQEMSRLSRRMKANGHSAPLGDPGSGVMLVVEQPIGPRILDALKLSVRAVGLPQAYVTYASTGLLKEEPLAIEPRALIAIGAGGARDIDAASYPLARQSFSEAEPGVWFSWTEGTLGLVLPSLTPALDDEAAKHRFWRAFLNLKAVEAPVRKAFTVENSTHWRDDGGADHRQVFIKHIKKQTRPRSRLSKLIRSVGSFLKGIGQVL